MASSGSFCHSSDVVAPAPSGTSPWNTTAERCRAGRVWSVIP